MVKGYIFQPQIKRKNEIGNGKRNSPLCLSLSPVHHHHESSENSNGKKIRESSRAPRNLQPLPRVPEFPVREPQRGEKKSPAGEQGRWSHHRGGDAAGEWGHNRSFRIEKEEVECSSSKNPANYSVSLQCVYQEIVASVLQLLVLIIKSS